MKYRYLQKIQYIIKIIKKTTLTQIKWHYYKSYLDIIIITYETVKQHYIFLKNRQLSFPKQYISGQVIYNYLIIFNNQIG